MATLFGPGTDEEKAPGDGEASAEGTKRELRGMSAKSSLSIARVLSSLDWDKHGECVHCTLTYWKKWPRTKDELAAEKSLLVARFGERAECGIWRLEFQSRAAGKVPHWHVLVWLSGRSRSGFERWLRQWWKRAAANSSDYGVKLTQGDGRASWYLSMHASKRAQSPPFAVGRWWGYVKREVLLSAQDLHNGGEISDRERVWWARLYRRSTGCKVRHEMGFSWFLPRAWQWAASEWVRSTIERERAERFRGKNPF
ncbi:MAG TPA: hypothetical protein VG838_13770 [Opitutaceae bacterium]|nr:hypothetical protein [Opitutaceae bacterium]